MNMEPILEICMQILDISVKIIEYRKIDQNLDIL